jgi:hypothetical protein
MNENIKKAVGKDTDGLITYEYIANHIGEIDGVLDELIDNMITVDRNGQFLVSAARYLHAIDADKYGEAINRLIAAAIDRDREHRYIGDLLPALWGEDYAEHVDELNAGDNNFRRIYKRLFPEAII